MSLDTDNTEILTVFCLVIGFFYSFFLYRREKYIKSKVLLFLLSILRFVFISFICYLFLNPTLNSIEVEEKKPLVLIAHDVSKSAENYNIISELSDLNEKLNNFDVDYLSFSNLVIDSLTSNFNNTSTNLSNLFSYIEENFYDRQISSLILATDGIINSGKNPLFEKSIDYSIYPIAIGDTNLLKDAKITNVKYNDISFLYNTFPMEISIKSIGCLGDESELSVWNENKKIYSKIILFDSNNFYSNEKLLIKSNKLGLNSYDVRLSKVNSEKVTANNVITANVEVVEVSYKILVLNDNASPDVSAYINSIKKNNYFSIDQSNSFEFKEKLLDYNLIVLFNVENFDLVRKIKDKKIPLMVFNFYNNKISSLFSDKINFNKTSNYVYHNCVVSESFNFFKISNEFLTLVSSAPPLYSFAGNYSVNENAQILLRQKTSNNIVENPVIVLDESTNNRSVFICAEGFWRWRMNDFKNNLNTDIFDNFYNKLTQYALTDKHIDRFKIKYKKQFSSDEDVVLKAILYDKVYQLDNSKKIKLSMTVNNEKFDYFLNSMQDSSYLINLGKLSDGLYSFTIDVVGEGIKKTGSFKVRSKSIEDLSLQANHFFLKSLANNFDGKLYYPNELDDLVDYINQNKQKSVYINTEKQIGIINIDWILLILLIIIFLEMFLRRFNGII